MQRSPNLRFFALECILYDICLCQLMAFRAYFLDVIFDGCLLDHRMLIIDVVIHTGGL